MIVVADTTPLCHLAWIGADWLLPRLFGEVHAPERVMSELRAEGAPDNVRQWAANPPGWLKIHPDAQDENRVLAFETIDAGEREALALALDLQASLIVVDERAARRVATDLGFVTTGTLGVLERSRPDAARGF
jgi:predicted nucleic acid-binding protein